MPITIQWLKKHILGKRQFCVQMFVIINTFLINIYMNNSDKEYYTCTEYPKVNGCVK